MNRCEDCKFHDIEYMWDEDDEYEEEYPFITCEKGMDEYIGSDEDCPYFHEIKRRKHAEKDTECDKCELLHECIKEGNVMDMTELTDVRQHYIGGRLTCKK